MAKLNEKSCGVNEEKEARTSRYSLAPCMCLKLQQVCNCGIFVLRLSNRLEMFGGVFSHIIVGVSMMNRVRSS